MISGSSTKCADARRDNKSVHGSRSEIAGRVDSRNAEETIEPTHSGTTPHLKGRAYVSEEVAGQDGPHRGSAHHVLHPPLSSNNQHSVCLAESLSGEDVIVRVLAVGLQRARATRLGVTAESATGDALSLDTATCSDTPYVERDGEGGGR